MTENKNTGEKRKKIVFNLSSAILGLFLIILIIKISGVTLDAIISGIINTKIRYLLVILLLTVGIIVLTSQKWEIIVKDLTGIKSITSGYFFFFSALGTASNLIIPHFGNFGLKTASLKIHHKIPLGIGTVSVLIEQLFDLVILTLFFIPSLLFFTNILSLEYSIVCIAILSVLIGCLMVFNHRKVVDTILRGYRSLIAGTSKLPFLMKRINVENIMLLDKSDLIKRETCTKLFYYSFIKQILIILRVYIVVVSLDMNVSLGALTLAAPIVQSVILIWAIPGAIGVLEAGWFGVLTLLGVSRVEIGVFVIVARILGDGALIVVTLIGYIKYNVSKFIFRTV